jgi:CheY-like chemotaxis protein
MNKTVLVIDDDKLALKSLTSLLTNSGLTVLEAGDGEEGLEQALKAHPDLVVTDVHMPKLTGFELIEQLRKDDWGHNVPIIVLTADEGTDAINQALSAGVTVFLTKSGVDSQTLADQVLTALG